MKVILPCKTNGNHFTGSGDTIKAVSIVRGRINAMYFDVLMNDTILEGIEMFNVTIDELSLSCGIVRGDIMTAAVEILDDDSKCTLIYNLYINV